MKRSALAFMIFAVLAVGYTVSRQAFVVSPDTTTTTTTTSGAVGWCVGPELARRWINGTGAAGTLHAWVKLTNIATTPCRLPEYVTLTYLLADGTMEPANLERQPLSTPLLDWRDRPVAPSAGPIEIPPAGQAAVSLSFPNDSRCPAVLQLNLAWAKGSRWVLPTYLVSQCNGTNGTVSRVFTVPS